MQITARLSDGLSRAYASVPVGPWTAPVTRSTGADGYCSADLAGDRPRGRDSNPEPFSLLSTFGGEKAVIWQPVQRVGLGQDTNDDDYAHHSNKGHERHPCGTNCGPRGPNGDRRQCRRQRHEQEQDEDG